MPNYHVAITGRDRRHLSALGAKLRVVVVGYREEKRGIVVDAYVPAEKIPWLTRKGYTVTRLEEVDGHDRQRQAEGRTAVDKRLKRGRYGDVIWGGGYLTADEVEACIALGEKNHADCFERIPLPNLTWEKRQCHAVRIGKGGGKRRTGRLLHRRRAWAGVGQPRHPRVLRDAPAPGLSKPEGRSSRWEEFHRGADSENR